MKPRWQLRLRIGVLVRWFAVKFWLKNQLKRHVWRWLCAILWRLSPRLRQEYETATQQAWAAGLAMTSFTEYVGRRLWPRD